MVNFSVGMAIPMNSGKQELIIELEDDIKIKEKPKRSRAKRKFCLELESAVMIFCLETLEDHNSTHNSTFCLARVSTKKLFFHALNYDSTV